MSWTVVHVRVKLPLPGVLVTVGHLAAYHGIVVHVRESVVRTPRCVGDCPQVSWLTTL